MQTRRTNTLRSATSVLAAALWTVGAAGIAVAAGTAGGGAAGGGHAAGGGGAAAGGGGGHVSSGGGAVSSGGHSTPAGGATPAPAVQSPSGTGVGTTVTHTGKGPGIVQPPGSVGPSNQVSSGTGSSRARNPYAPHGGDGANAGNRGNRNYGVVYGYPFYPFSYGWNSGWYGSNYGNYYNNYPNNGSTFSNDNGDNGNYNHSNDNAQPQQVTQAVPTVTGASSVTAQAVEANAVDKSPALIAANGTVNQAQAAYNDARTRALANLRQQSSYQEALARRHAAAGEVRSAKTDAGPATPAAPPSSAVVAAPTAKLEAGDEVTKMEEQAVASDPAASAAKARLEQATTDRDLLKAQLTAQAQSAR